MNEGLTILETPQEASMAIQPLAQQYLKPGLQCYWLLWRDVLLNKYLLFLLLICM